jgi:hypothetical protein
MPYTYAKPRSEEEKKEITPLVVDLINMSQKAIDAWKKNTLKRKQVQI